MTFEQLTSSLVPAADSSPTSSLVIGPFSQSNMKSHVANPCAPGCERVGCRQTCTSTAEIFEPSTSPHGAGSWIASQRASLARIFHALAQAKASRAIAPAWSGRCSEQLTLFSPDWSSSKTRRKLGPRVDATLSGLSWRGDIPGETERLPLLLSEQVIAGIGGGSLLPTLTVTSNWNRKGSGEKSGDGLVTRLKLLPTLTASDGTGGPGRGKKRLGGDNLRTMLPMICASDYKSPYSAEGYQKQALKRFKPLRDTLAHTTGHRLTPEFAEWWMGWPLRWTASAKVPASRLAATGRSRSRRQRHG